MSTDCISYIIIDDHPFIRDGVNSFIQKNSGYTLIAEFDNIRAALNEPLPAIPDVLLLDLNLNGVDALKMVPQLRRRFPASRMIAFTQYDCTPKELEAAGMHGYVQKTERGDLIEAIATVVSGSFYFKTTTPVSLENSLLPDTYEILKRLTKRQLEVAELIHHHYTNKKMGQILFTSEATIETHRKAIKQKLGAKTKEEFYALLRAYFDIPENSNWPEGLPKVVEE